MDQLIMCKHCSGFLIRQGTLWHEEGEIIFPQYCKSKEPSSQLHEPDEKERSDEARPVAWIATKGNSVLHLAAADGWKVEAVLHEDQQAEATEGVLSGGTHQAAQSSAHQSPPAQVGDLSKPWDGKYNDEVARTIGIGYDESAVSQEGSAPASTPVATDGYQPVAPASAAPLPDGAYVDIVFDGPPSHESGRFVEVEDADGKSVGDVGEWVHRTDGYWVLRIPDPRLAQRLAVPEGCVAVPREPTTDVMKVGIKAFNAGSPAEGCLNGIGQLERAYRAMLAAAKEAK